MKNSLKESILKAIKCKENLKKIDILPDVDLYIKKPTIADNKLLEQIAGSENETEKMIAILLFDESGDRVFDYTNQEDIDFIASFANIDIVNKIKDEYLKLNNVSSEDLTEEKK